MPPEVTVKGSIVYIRGGDKDTELEFQKSSGTAKLVIPKGADKGHDGTSCEQISLINAALAANFSISGDIETRNSIQAFQNTCPTDHVRWPAGMGTIDPQENLPNLDGPQDPSATFASQTGAPVTNPDIVVSAVIPPAGKSDGRTLNEQYLDPSHPMQDFDIVQNLTEQGFTGNALDEALKRIIRNDPPLGKSHPVFSRDDNTLSETTADPIVLFTGQFAVSVTDLEIPSRGFPILFTRSYRSGEPFFGSMGYNWDHNYNMYLRPLTNGGVAVWTGEYREEIYNLLPSGLFDAPTGIFRKLERKVASATRREEFILSDREGFAHVFSVPAGWPHPEKVPLVELSDSYGNAHVLEYNFKGQLQRISDRANRFIRLAYGDCGLVETVSDHTGRTWRYFHDADIEHLIAAQSPGTGIIRMG